MRQFQKVVFFHLLLSPLFLGWTARSSLADEYLPQSLLHFLEPAYFLTQEMWSGEIGGRNIITAFNGDVLVIKGGASSQYKRSTNGGLSWTTANASGAARFSNAVLDETNGRIILFNGSSNVRSFSTNNGFTWSANQSHLPAPDRLGFRPTSYSSMQTGVTLRYGPRAGRLIAPSRTQFSQSGSRVRGFAYSSAIYSDDGGQTWRSTEPFPVFGTGEAAIVELKDGRLLYNSREHMSIGNRFWATSYDGGETWVSPYRDPTLPDGPRGTSYGCMGGLIRLPVDEFDVLVYSNLDTDRGVLPDEIGGTRTRERENITVWASFDGGQTWPVKRLIFGGPAAYSNLGVGRAGTASQGKIFLMYDGGPEGRNTAAQFVTFNLTWLLDGADIGDFLPLDQVSGEPAEVVGQYVYHRGYTVAPDPIDTQKILAKEGIGPRTLDMRNLINTSHGINGLLFDISNLAAPDNVGINDFQIQVSPTDTFNEASHPPSGWQQGPSPSSVTVTPGQISRVLVEWENGSIMNRWARITIKANQTTGLDEPAVFYLGHLLGEVTGEAQGIFTVSFGDIVPIRAAVGQLVGADSILDIDKNGLISFADISAMRPNVGTQLTCINIP